MGKLLADDQIAAYRRDGFLCPLAALAADEAAALQAWLDDVERRHGDLPPRERRHRLLRFKPHLLFPRLDRLITDPRLLDPVEDLIGGDILVWASAFFIKDAADPGFVSWHQDSATYGLEGGDLVTAWLAVTPATTANAAMRFIPGSHREGPRRHVEIADPANMLSRGETIADADEVAAIDVALAPGEMSLHHIDLIHGSRPNHSDRPRIGYAIRYCAPSMRPVVGPASARLVRGRDRRGHFELEPAPRGEHDAATRTAHARALALRERSVFATLDS